MKKFALISGLLFIVVYFCVNTFTRDGDSFEMGYPSMTVSTLTDMDKTGQSAGDEMASLNPAAVQAPSTYIIIASFSDLEQARKTADAYTAQYQADILILPPTAAGFYRISYGRYPTAAEAEATLGSVKQNGFPDAWILASK